MLSIFIGIYIYNSIFIGIYRDAIVRGGGDADMRVRLYIRVAASTAAPRAWWTCLARWWSVVNVQHTHDDAFGPQVPAK